MVNSRKIVMFTSVSTTSLVLANNEDIVGCCSSTASTCSLIIYLVYVLIYVFNIQLFRERLSEKMCTRQPRKVIWNMINILFLTSCSCRTDFCCFPLALANICPWPLVPFFQISLENSADKTTHNTFRDCRVHFFRQPLSKQLYIQIKIIHSFYLTLENCQLIKYG